MKVERGVKAFPLPLGQAGGLIILLTLATEVLVERLTTWLLPRLAFVNNKGIRVFVFLTDFSELNWGRYSN